MVRIYDLTNSTWETPSLEPALDCNDIHLPQAETLAYHCQLQLLEVASQAQQNELPAGLATENLDRFTAEMEDY